MAWTAPKTWATQDLVTANDLNLHLRDNELYLLPGTLLSAIHYTLPADVSNSSTSYTWVHTSLIAPAFNAASGEFLVISGPFMVYGNPANANIFMDIKLTNGEIYAGTSGWLFYGYPQTNAYFSVVLLGMFTGLQAGGSYAAGPVFKSSVAGYAVKCMAYQDAYTVVYDR